MNGLKKLAVATAVGAALGLAAGPAAADSVYGGAEILIQNLTIAFSPTTGAAVSTFNFGASDNANLVGAADSNTVNCGGTLATNSCSTTSPVLDATAANAPGGTVTRNNLDFSFFGPGTDTYANSESAIITAELVQGVPTNTGSVSEAELQNGVNGIASAATNVQSTTGLTLNFSTSAPGSVTITFQADPYLLSFIDSTGTSGATSLANISAQIRLNGAGQTAQWNPDGTIDAFAICSGGLTCTETADTPDLNRQTTVAAPPIPATDAYSVTPGFTNYSITISGLLAGAYSLALTADTSVILNQTAAVPEPGTLALLGLGLAGLGFAGRRIRNSR
jgi:hypothetical protein